MRRHWHRMQLPCAKCHGVIDYTAKKTAEALVIGRIVAPAEGKRRGWTKVEINALDNFEPRHASCPKARELEAAA
jgi:hypothetical protein